MVDQKCFEYSGQGGLESQGRRRTVMAKPRSFDKNHPKNGGGVIGLSLSIAKDHRPLNRTKESERSRPKDLKLFQHPTEKPGHPFSNAEQASSHEKGELKVRRLQKLRNPELVVKGHPIIQRRSGFSKTK